MREYDVYCVDNGVKIVSLSIRGTIEKGQIIMLDSNRYKVVNVRVDAKFDTSVDDKMIYKVKGHSLEVKREKE
jgi:hypothetical protein